MTFYKCDCGVAHGNVHGPWFDNQCPNCEKFPSFTLNNYQVFASKKEGKFVFLYLSKITNSLCKILEPSIKRASVERIMSEIWYNEQVLDLEKSIFETKRRSAVLKIDYKNLFVSPEAAKMIKEWDEPTPEETAAEIPPPQGCKVVVSQAAGPGGFINITGGTGPIFPYGDMPEVTMVPITEIESKTKCTCDTFLLMQSGCKCGFFEQEQRLKNEK